MNKLKVGKISLLLFLMISFGLVSGGLAHAGDVSAPAGTVQLSNPLGDGVTIQAFIGKIITGILGIIGSIALALFVYGGFLIMTAAGNPAGVKKGREVMIYAAFGLLIIFSSYTLTKFVLTTVAGS